MRISGFGRFVLCGAAASLLAGCGGGQAPAVSGGAIPQTPALRSSTAGEAPDARKKHGIYVSTSSAILGYRFDNRGNGGRVCKVHGGVPGGIAADSDGNLIDPDGADNAILIFKGPKMCGPKLGSIADPYGQPSDASSLHAATGTIAVANIFDTSGAGSVSVCTFSGGCTQNLTNANMYEVAGVALAVDGDCWASATNSSGVATLTYFKRCAGSGETATGYENAYYGGLDIDGNGHLLAISAFDSKLYVYKGCKPACTLFAGPYSLQGESVFGHLNRESSHFAAADFQSGSVDVYRYGSKSLAYEYSFNNGLGPSDGPDGVTYNRRAKQ